MTGRGSEVSGGGPPTSTLSPGGGRGVTKRTHPGRTRRVRLALLAGAWLAAFAAPAAAQPLASPLASVRQVVDSTTVTVEYYRPSARGRAIFGRLVPWGQMWTPGANWATTIEVDHDVRIAERALPRGKYSVWMIPGPDTFTVVLSRAARRFHVQRPDPADEQLRFAVRADSGPHVEMLTFSFPEVARDTATLRFQWARTVVPIRLDVGASPAPTVAPSHPWSAYAGVYEVDFDWTSTPVRYEVTERDGALWVRTAPDAVEPGFDTQFDLLPMGGDRFHPRQYKDGRLVGVEADEVITFHVDGARATGFDIRGTAESRTLGRATRARD